MQAFKTKPQMIYNPVQGIQCQVSDCDETLFSASLGTMLYRTTRSKSLINTLYDMNMSALYNKVACIKEDVAEAKVKKCKITVVCLFLHAFHPSRMFSFQFIIQITKLIRQIASKN